MDHTARSRARSRSRSRSRSPSAHHSHSHSHTRRRNSSTDVARVIHSLPHGKYYEFIDYYLSKYDALRGRGQYFRNFIDSCRKCLLTNDNYKHYNAISERCVPITRGPTPAYAGLLAYIVHHAEKYSKDDAEKIHELLFLFEQQGITYNIVIPRDDAAMTVFKTHGITPGYSEIPDGRVEYCSMYGKVHRDGMEISNTRVNALLSKVHGFADDTDADADDDDNVQSSGKRRTVRRSRYRKRGTRRR